MAAMLPSTSTLGVEHMETAKLDSDSPSQVEQEELEVNLHIEGSGRRSLKRRASLSWGEGSAESPSGKRLKDEHAGQEESKDFPANPPTNAMNRRTLIDDLAQELECGCCAALVYNPVTILPCQHSFCGSCCVLWIKNGGTTCPSCRGLSTSVIPSRALQSMVNVLLRADPSRIRTLSERAQADEVYRSGQSLRIPPPREPSPEPALPRNTDYALPCPHCIPGNPFRWNCPNPIPDPETNQDHGWLLEDGAPPGHGFCGHCETLVALRAPSTSRCDFCQVSFCGIGIPERCCATLLHSQHLNGFSDLGDLIQAADIYECFEGNTVEVEILFDYLTEHRMAPKQIYQEIVQHIQNTPEQFTPLFDQDLFTEIHGVAGGADPDPAAPRQKICRWCATEVFLWGIRDWWILERRKGRVSATILGKPDCAGGKSCRNQKDPGEALLSSRRDLMLTPSSLQITRENVRPR
ncbi:hypothetical protein BJ322DRAFT_1091620 [Thelephora terrestris]|uniref:RING-type domain-containing protein n=1 Tax=Thelephora terrestris TaxID=56493 RepID=A0A9P6H3E9_9AGAM|nr:hypothetical protein BJ322DRAFT_1091620 [Thelephora terrestris]